ncbi:MAG TPA: class I SAM-dependent methyltransferase [Thermomonas sp.]|nr:class I SAM-dependent methyltransferase [Thermomonas sp.]
MDVVASSFESEAVRRADRGLFARWLFTQRMLQHRELVEAMPILCANCGDATQVAATDAARPVCVREGVVCARCGMSARLRVAVAMLSEVADASDRIYVTEQSTPLFAALQPRYQNLRGSEFEPDEAKRQEMAAYLAGIGGSGEVNFEDVTRLSMSDQSQDVVLSFDVLEHVPDYRAALREFARVLRPGGILQATFPFTDAQDTLVRARVLDDGGVEHLMEPEFHGDPIGGPVLCFYHFGWDVLDEVRRAGFSRAAMVAPWCPEQGVYYGHWVLQATR